MLFTLLTLCQYKAILGHCRYAKAMRKPNIHQCVTVIYCATIKAEDKKILIKRKAVRRGQKVCFTMLRFVCNVKYVLQCLICFAMLSMVSNV